MPEIQQAFEADTIEAAPSQSSLHPFRLLWQHRSLVALGVVVGCVLGGLYYSRATPVYQSSAQVLVLKKTPDAMPLPNSDTHHPFAEDYLATHQALICSPAIVGAAVRKADLASLPSFAGQGDPTGEIIQSLKVTRETIGGQPTNVLTISYRGRIPEDCAAVLDAVIDSYQQFLTAWYKNVTNETADLIVKANDLLEKKLKKKQDEYDKFSREHPALWKGKDGVSAAQERLLALESKYSSLRLQETEVHGRLGAFEKAVNNGRHSRAELVAMVSQVPGRGRPEGGTASTMPEERLEALELEEKSLLEDYGPEHPKVRDVRSKLTLLRARLGRLNRDAEDDALLTVDPVKTYLQSLRLELENVRLAAEEVARMVQEEQKKAESLRRFEIEDGAYRREIAMSEQLFAAITKRLDEVSILKNVPGGYVAETISPPGPGGKVYPRPLFVFTAAVLVGLLLGLGLAYLAEISDQSFRNPEEIRRRLGLPVVGHIPYFGRGDEELVAAEGPRLDPALRTVYHPKSREAEAYRGVRTAVFFSGRGAGHMVIQVTSPDMGDGKSTLIGNLAVSIAQSEKKVLLIDADLRRPRVHKLFDLSADQGLSSVIAGEAELPDVIQATPVPGLSILPCGPIPPNPAELLTLPRFQETLSLLREQYDFVLVDTPPLLAVTDPCIVVPYVDGVILTVRISKNARMHASRAKEILSTLGARVLGVVVNGGESDSKGYSYGGYSYRYYQDYSSDGDDAPAPERNGKNGTHGNGEAGRSVRHRASARSSGKKNGLLTWLFNR